MGIWAFNAITQKRHYIVGLRVLDFCRCGCGGWCTLYPVMLMLHWSLISLKLGERPAMKHNHKSFEQGDALLELLHQEGTSLGVTAAICWIKGDWAEFCHSLGLPSVSSFNSPSPYSTLTKKQLHEHYESMSFPARADSYDIACRACEITVTVNTEEDRMSILAVLHYAKQYSRVKRQCLR